MKLKSFCNANSLVKSLPSGTFLWNGIKRSVSTVPGCRRMPIIGSFFHANSTDTVFVAAISKQNKYYHKRSQIMRALRCVILVWYKTITKANSDWLAPQTELCVNTHQDTTFPRHSHSHPLHVYLHILKGLPIKITLRHDLSEWARRSETWIILVNGKWRWESVLIKCVRARVRVRVKFLRWKMFTRRKWMDKMRKVTSSKVSQFLQV
jgi:hypothetical protein